MKGDAIVTAVIYTWNGAVCKFLRWVITGGVPAKPQMISVTGATAGWNGNGHADVEAYSANPDDPYFLAYYSANALYRVDATGAVTHKIATATWGANSNYNCVDVCTFNNAKYAAIYEGAHFTYGEFKAYMFDVTTPDQMTGACRGGGQCGRRRADDGIGRRIQDESLLYGRQYQCAGRLGVRLYRQVTPLLPASL